MKQFKTTLVCMLMLIISTSAFAQSKIIGKVSDPQGDPIIGASVIVKGTSNGTITDMNGGFSLNATTGTLVVSYIGYKTQEIAIAGKTSFAISLKDDTELLDEVVVVGYGTQKKATLSGSITQVKGDDVLKGKSTQSIASALQGTIPGLTITRSSSRPGNESTSITLRGGISVNKDGNAPMIVIDGVEAYEWELSQINPNDVESISVLKDAAAAIYGTKAGGGVILVTTKRGKEGKVKVTYSGNVHTNVVGNRFPVADGQTYAQMLVQSALNDATANPAGTIDWWLFPKTTWESLAQGERLEGTQSGTWRVLDPTSNQFDAVYGNTWGQSHNVAISGGNDKLKAMTSFGYAKDRSLLKFVFDGQQKYNFRTNVDYKVNEWIKTEFNVSYDKRITGTPTQGIGHGIQDFYVFPLYNEYGQYYDTFGNNNLLAKLDEGGRTNDTEEILRLGGKLVVDLNRVVKGLSVTGNANVRIRNHKKIVRTSGVTMYDWSGETASPDGKPDYTLGTGAIKSQTSVANRNVKVTQENVLYQTYSAFMNYNRTFIGHNIGLMAGMTGEKTHYEKLYGERSGMGVDELDDINLGDATTAKAEGGSNENGMISYLGRLNYDYRGIYLLEGLFRRDGSSKFNKDSRWANFSGISGGVRLSELDLVKEWSIFDNLKIRASYGETGSQSGIGNYDYLSTIGTGTTIFGYTGKKYTTAYIKGMTSTNRTWERVATTNVGLDFALLNNRLSGSLEYYVRENKDMLISMTYPLTLGTSAPKTNSGNFEAKGWELQLNWNDKIGQDFAYNVGFSLADAKTTVTKYNGGIAISAGVNNAPIASDTNGSFIEGKPLNALYVYKTNGYLQNWDEVKAYYTSITKKAGGIHPIEGTANQLSPGCVRKVDMDGSGSITTEDLVYYGDANPHYQFGVNWGASYKGFDFSMFIQGVGQQYILREGQLAAPFSAIYTNQNTTFIGNTWTETNTNARYPIMSGWKGGARTTWNYKQYNDININNCWYARAKNIVLGYTLPKQLIKKAGIENLRLYVAADNLFEFSNVKDGFDPESKSATGQGNVDVYSRTISFGIDLTF